MEKGWLQKQLNIAEEMVNSFPKWMRVDEGGNCMAIKPITPSQAISKKRESLPDEVIEAFNELIAEKWDGHKASFKQDEIASIIAKKLKISRNKLFDNGWLDVEDIYRKAGWEVVYDAPAFNETYDATFCFRKK